MSDSVKTKLVTGGRRKEWTHGVVNPPVYRASTCLFESYQEMRERSAAPTEMKLFYGRKGTPTQWALREAINDLEGGAGTHLYPSGIAAVTTSIMALVKTGDHILITDTAYEPTRVFADGILKDFGVEAEYYDPMLGADIEKLVRPNTTLIMMESPGSLTFEVQDIPSIVEVAKRHDLYTVIDNTWSTPLLFKPLDFGIDISVEACTKYFCGHSDVMIGSASANERAFKKLSRCTFQMGHTVSADDAYLTLRGMRTLAVRLKEHEAAALTVANWLSDHPLVHQVLHPALPSCPGHDHWKRDFNGSSGLFSIVLNCGERDDTAVMVDHMKLFKMGFSWGGYESLILPCNMAGTRSATRWDAPGPVLRLHIGLEDTNDLIADLDAGLERYRIKIHGNKG